MFNQPTVLGLLTRFLQLFCNYKAKVNETYLSVDNPSGQWPVVFVISYGAHIKCICSINFRTRFLLICTCKNLINLVNLTEAVWIIPRNFVSLLSILIIFVRLNWENVAEDALFYRLFLFINNRPNYLW